MSEITPRVFRPLPGVTVHAFAPEWGAVLEHSRTLLDASELARAAAYHQPLDVARFITGRAALRRLVGHALGMPPEMLQWDQGAHGKLGLHAQHAAGLEFNLSHSGNWVLVALSSLGAVGVDVERIEDHRDLSALAARVFSPREREILNARSGRQLVEFFYRTWTCKEAWIKALGAGLSYPLEQLDLHEAAQASPGTRTSVMDPEGGRSWQCWRLSLDSEHEAAVVLASSSGIAGSSSRGC